MKAPEILDKAAQHMRDRAATYDKPEGERSMGLTVAIFNLHHGTSLTEAQGWHLMQILKDVRLFARPGYHADSAEDCTAYSALKAEAMALQHKSVPDGIDTLNAVPGIDVVAALAAHAPVVVPPPPEYAPESVAIDNSWIDHDGGRCPVEEGTQIEVMLRDGSVFTGAALADFCMTAVQWTTGMGNGESDPCPLDIVKWKPA